MRLSIWMSALVLAQAIDLEAVKEYDPDYGIAVIFVVLFFIFDVIELVAKLGRR